MDSLTQAVLGAAVGYAVGGRYLGRKATLWGLGLGTLPDLDVLIQNDDPIDSYVLHRSWSHSFFVTGVASVPIGLIINKLHNKTNPVPGQIILMVSLVFFTHILLDSMTIYGTQIFWLLSDFVPALPPDPVGLGSVAIIDPIFTLPLLLATIWIFLRGNINSIGNIIVTQRVVVTALALSSIYLGWGLYVQNSFEKLAKQQMASNTIKVDQIFASPTFGNSLLWYILVREGDNVHYGLRSLLDDKNKPIEFGVIERRSEIFDALPKKTQAKKVMDFSKGLYRFAEDANEVSIADIRMGLPPNFDLHFKFAVADRSLDDGTLNALIPTKHLFPQVYKENFIFVWDRIFDDQAKLDLIPPKDMN